MAWTAIDLDKHRICGDNGTVTREKYGPSKFVRAIIGVLKVDHFAIGDVEQPICREFFGVRVDAQSLKIPFSFTLDSSKIRLYFQFKSLLVG